MFECESWTDELGQFRPGKLCARENEVEPENGGGEVNKPKWEALKAGRSWSNESNGAGMAGCISEGGRVVAYLPSHFKDAPLLCAAPELLEALEALLESAKSANASLNWATGLNDEPASFDQARTAIRKARGE